MVEKRLGRQGVWVDGVKMVLRVVMEVEALVIVRGGWSSISHWT